MNLRQALVPLVLVLVPLLMPGSAASAPTVVQAGRDSPACNRFPPDNYWYADITSLPVHERSAEWLSHMSPGNELHPDFGPSSGDGPDYGIPITRTSERSKVRVHFRYAAESDRVRYPLGPDTRIEGGRRSTGDRHAIVVTSDGCRLYETWHTRRREDGWHAGSGATWSLTTNELRPDGWTSADAAGLPIYPGLLRWREVRSGVVDHAVRFTTDVTSTHHVWPARHDAGSRDSLDYPPMGARFRLRSEFDESSYSARARAVIEAFKRYGLVLADNGSPWFFQGERNPRWPLALLDELKTIPASAFEAVDTSGLMVSEDSAAVSGWSQGDSNP